ncbi:MAG: CocE/NonD family hydrolase [Thermoleophilia bacterium]
MADRLRSYRVIENAWIPMSDGAQLAAKIWLPVDAEENPVPAILEYIPYRKRDFKARRDAQIHGYFAGNGYAGVRVDLRGSGDSDGVLRDEYLQQELDDGLEILRWLAAQPWCSGRVGMFGLSWGGFNGLQIAALRPPELGAVVTVCSSDDRYKDDVHYMGGCLLNDNLSWASTMLAYNSLPPDPAVVGERWHGMWLERLEGSGLWLKNWLEHQRRDHYWSHASVCESFSAVEVPVFAVSGWADGYSNTVFRLMEHLDVPRKALIGPWGHKYPHMGGPGPTIDFLRESVRWFDRWLKDIDNGADEDPRIRAWMLDTVSPLDPTHPGRWVAEPDWPSDNVRETDFALAPGRILLDEAETVVGREEEQLEIQSPLGVGLFAGKWTSYSEVTDLPQDQRAEDGGALVFDSPVLTEDVEILGAPWVELEVSSNKTVAQVVVRLEDVSPDGTATRVTYGLLNLTHRESDSDPEELYPGERYRVQVRLNQIAQRFPAGNRLRLAVSTSYWPLAWPAPEPPRLTVYVSGARLVLPCRAPRESDRDLRDLGEPETAPGPEVTLLAPARQEWKVEHNLATNEVALNIVADEARYRLEEIDLEVRRDTRERYSFLGNNYSTLRGEVESLRALRRGDWQVRTVTHTVLTATRTHFRVQATLDAYEGDARVYSKSWDERVPRDHL